jgi:hypothetical protein
MNYRTELNNYEAKDSIANQIRNIYYGKTGHQQVYSSKVYQGELGGPTKILDTAQEVTTVPYPTYAGFLSGRYHMNK